jgi:tetratricopeptide (TPR) repeat protein
MSRRRRRKKRLQGEGEALQVELLSERDSRADGHEADDVHDEEAPPGAAGAEDGPGSSDATATGDESGEVDHEARQVAPGDAFVDRWVRAVGRSAPAPSAGVVPRTPPNGHEAHESARDHAAARVRPAGEPLARAKDLVQRGRVDEAIQLYMGIITVNPTNLKAHNNLGVLLDGLRQYEAALEHFEAAERIAPESVEVLTNYASTLTSLARYDEAEALLRRAHRLDAESLQVRLAVGILYFRRGLYGQTELELSWVCARDRDNGQAFYYRGEALNRLGRFDEARQAMERAKVLLPNDPRPFYTLGHLYDRKHQVEEAAEMYRHARRLQRR